MTQGVQEQVGFIAAIESESHFFAVGLEMLRADSMPASHDAALQERERRFDRVGVDVSLRIEAELVPDGLVPSVFAKVTGCAPVGIPIIGEQDVHILRDILADVLFEGAALGVSGVEETQIAAALTNADNDFLVVEPRAFTVPPVLTADVGFVHFDFAAQHGLVYFDHRSADAVAEIPSRFVASESQRPLNLARAHALLGFAEKQSRKEPLVERQVRVIENRASGDGELVVAILAVVESLFGFKFHDFHLAARATDAFGPAQAGEQFAALFVSREHTVYVN